MIDYYETKSQPITRVMVMQAYKKVSANKGSAGVDDMGWTSLEQNLDAQLYIYGTGSHQAVIFLRP